VIVRDCEARDIPAIATIYRHAVRHGRASFEIDPPDEAEMARRREILISGGYAYIVAEIEGELAGYAYAGMYRARPAYKSTVENSVYVREGLHRQGVGKRLLNALIDQSAALGFRQMIAVIGDSNNIASIKLHEAVGFSLVGVLRSVGWKHEQWLDSVLMQRALGDGDKIPA
jgi:phosphinothricin acetyltransferase